ncbi:hypothetical protein ACQKM1_15655 [Peribacillus frigoritolerans]|uniref:hypothetical protein n=1 Tax=Peribacillus frigoritolerans TaxID=450367 RepID=UPI003CFCDC14
MGHLEKINNLLFWILTVIFLPLAGLMISTTEYAGSGGKIGPIKEMLDRKISISVLMMIIIILLILLTSFGIMKYVFSALKKEVDIQVDIKLNRLKSNHNSDRKTLNQIEDLLPVDFMINFFKKKDFDHETFLIDDIHLIDDFLDNCLNPNLKFIDENLEEQRILLITKMEEFGDLLTNNNEQLGVSNAWRIPRKSRTSVIQSANTYSDEIWKLYEQMLSSGRKKLGGSNV